MNRTEHRTPATLPPVALTPEEAAAVAAALAAHPEGPYAAAGRTALEKVLAALEPDPAQRARLLASSRRLAAEAATGAEVRRHLEQGLAEQRVLVIGYRDREGRWSERAVEPQLLVRAGAHEFLLAWCRERSELRWFREDRIGAAEVTGEPAQRHDLTGVGAPPSAGHPAGRKLPRTPPPPGPPRLRVLPGGRA